MKLGSLLRNLVVPTLQINKNQLHYLSTKDFGRTGVVKNLELQENEIKGIDADIFSIYRTTLKSLDLSSNLLTSLNGSVRYLSKLEVLKLKNNSLQVRKFFKCICIQNISAVVLLINFKRKGHENRYIYE